MQYTLLLFVASIINSFIEINAEARIAIAHLTSGNIVGNIQFEEINDGVRVNGTIVGLDAGLYGFHVHELGDISTCVAAGAHFNPDGNDHGGRLHDVRHVGDLGNIEFVGNDSAVAIIDFIDTVISLRGRNSILGRALVLHEQEDDLGLGGHQDSLTTGNAGARVACGVIGILSPATPWNSAMSIVPSAPLLLAALALKHF